MKTLEMPSFGADMVRGRVVEWRVAPGDRVCKGDTVALIETAKGVIDMEVFEDVTIEQLLVSLDEECDVGTPIIAVSGGRSDNTGEEADEQQDQPMVPPALIPASASASETIVVPRLAPSTVKISPAARLLAWQQQRDTSGLDGSGPDGAIVLSDLHRQRPVSSESERAPLLVNQARAGGFDPVAMRGAIAAVVSRSNRDIPHYYLSLEVDLEKCQAWVNAYNADADPEHRMLVNAPLMCAIAQALQRHKEFNGFYQQGEFVASEAVHLGVAIALRGHGLVTPTIHHAQTLPPAQMMQRLKSLVERAKYGGLKVSEFQDATATLSSIGDRGADQIFGVIFPPQVAMIGIGKVSLKPVVETSDGGSPRIAIRSRVNISLGADHRVSDGYSGTRLLNDINKRLQKPEAL